MKRRLLFVFTLTTGLILLLTWAVAAQGVKGTNDIPPASSVIFTDSVESRASQGAANLSYTPDITLTSAFTMYLPAAFKGYVGCSTIPTLIGPTDGSNLSTLIPLFRWDSGNDPNTPHLALQVAKDHDFTQDVWSFSTYRGTGVGEFRFPRNLEPATVYFWRAWLECGSTDGPYSDVWSFTTGSGGVILPAPALVAPANGSMVPTTSVTLQWSLVSSAVEYLVRLKELGSVSTTIVRVSETQTTIDWLNTNTTYEWRVSARNDYAVGADSETWQFTTPADSSSVSLHDLNHTVVIEVGSTTSVFEGHDSK